MSQLPGSEALGFGFNILGEYDVSSLTRQIYGHQRMDAQSWTYQPTGITYSVPDNTSVVPNTQTTSTTQVFTTQESFQSYFSAKAGVKGSYATFRGEFSSAFSMTSASTQSFSYGLYEADFNGWNVVQSDLSSNWLSPGFTSDPDVEDLPTVYDVTTQDKFFAFFRKFGTHIVTQVTVGGNLDYFVAVEDSYSSNEVKISANISLEVQAVFYSASAESQAEWNQLGQSWANSRQVTISAVGGSASVLNSMTPTFGTNEANAFATWSSAVMENPAVTEFMLTPISAAFSGSQAQAVSQALQAYLSGAVVAIANSDYTPGSGPGGGNFTSSATVLVSGRVILPSPPVTPPTPPRWGNNIIPPVAGYQLVILDGRNFTTLMSHLYYQPFGTVAQEQAIYNAMMDDLHKLTPPTGYIAVVAGFAIDLMNYPTKPFSDWLLSVGASMEGWRQYLGFTGSPGQVSYVCIGRQGVPIGAAMESFAAATDWADLPSQSTVDVSAVALLYADTNKLMARGALPPAPSAAK
ncbi:MAG: MAC/perforin domain-containing protein [Nannocystaceae bacterium]